MIHEGLLTRFFSLSLELLATANTSGFFVDLNPSWEPTLGYSQTELKSRPFIDFVHPDDRDRTNQEAAKLFRGEKTIYFENRYLCKDGSYCWMAWSASFSSADQLIFACARDISLQKSLSYEKEQALSALARFQALADATSDFVGMIDAQHQVLYVNPAGRRIIGHSENGSLPESMAAVHPTDYGHRVLNEALPAALTQGSWTGEGVLRHQSGKLIPVSQVVVSLRGDDGQHVGFGTIMRDLSAIESYKRNQEELLNQQTLLREMIQAMETPIIPLTERIIIMPLIGSIDAHRAEGFLSAALEGAASRRTQVVIIDITGMKHVDTSVGATLVRAAAALRLIGTEVVLTGIRADVARSLVSLGVDIPVNTRSTLQSGIAYALAISGEVLDLPAGTTARKRFARAGI